MERGLPDLFTGAPFSNLDTSRQAAKEIEPHLDRLEATVLTFLGEYGQTCEEVENASGLRHTTVSARLRGLVLKGLVYDSDLRRKTSSGRSAIVWRAR